MAAQQLYDSTI